VTPLTIPEWQQAYQQGLTLEAALQSIAERIQSDDPAWILCLGLEAWQAQARTLQQRLTEADGELKHFPLFGVPFVVKDNIDVAGLPTTAACPDYAYTAQATAPTVQALIDAGALLLGKANLDQFATGLVGVRSPFGAVPNPFNSAFISGGSSSGSASLVARGLAAFSLGTDTAGSGRVPAAFNNIVGLKPTRGWFSTRGVVPACRSLDCVSVFAHTVSDADLIAQLIGIYDAEDPYANPAPASFAARRFSAKPRLGVPTSPQFFGDAQAEAAFEKACEGFRALGAELVPVDFAPLHALAALLYDGPWIAERYAAIEDFIKAGEGTMDPVVRSIIERARGYTAVDAFKAEYQRAERTRAARNVMQTVDALLVPTAPTIYTQDDIVADPVTLNSRLGTYTNFVNLMDACALALPAGFRADGLPTGVTLIGPAWSDRALAELGLRWQRQAPSTLGTNDRLPAAPPAWPMAAGPATVRVAVVGAHLSGMPLNYQLTERSAVWVESTQTASDYRFYALPGTVPPKPGLVRGRAGAPIDVELWDMPAEAFGSFVALIPAPLGIGTLALADGREVKGFICESWATEGALDITSFGGWRAFMADQRAKATAKEASHV
jgi:allophanate hydrolase